MQLALSKPGKRAHWFGMAGVALAALGWVAILFPNTLRNPDDVFFSNAGDGIKNYFVAMYYVRYDAGHRFTGMNYPFGEHLNYPDLQPLLSGSLSLIRRLGWPAVADHTVGIINVLLLLALVLTPVVLYLILRRTRVPVPYAAAGALLIGFMSPQLARFDGHMPLGYCCCVPALWYLLIRLQQAPRRGRWYVAYATACVLMGLMSAYYLAAGTFFLLAHAVVLGAQGGRRAAPVAARMALTAVVALVGFRLWLALTDPVTDRPQNPYGLLVYVASLASVFGPPAEPLRAVWQAVFRPDEPSGEGVAYVGAAADVVLLLTLGLLGRYAWRRQWQRIWRPTLPQHLRTGLWASGLLLALAFALPLRIPGAVDYAGPLKQFRSLGRFAWPFYYVFTTYAVYYLYRLGRYLRAKRIPGLVPGMMGLLGLIWASEVVQYTRTWANKMDGRTGAVQFVSGADNYLQLLSWANRDAQSFQAILPLPYFSIGTDKVGLEGTNEIVFQAYRAALNLGLPLLTLQMARSSVSQTLAETQLLSGPLLPKPVIQRFPNNKPVLVLTTPQPLSLAEQRLVGMSHKIAGNETATLYEVPVTALAVTDLGAEAALAAQRWPTLPERPGGLRCTTTKGVLVDGFDRQPDRRGRLAPGAFAELADKFSTLYSGPMPAPADTGRYEVAVWVNAQTGYGLGNLQVKQYDAAGRELEVRSASGSHSTEIDGEWVRVAVQVRVQAATRRLEVLYENRDLLADDLLIRPLDTDVYYYAGTGPRRRLVKNGYALTPASLQ